jgi:hypothetical protein
MIGQQALMDAHFTLLHLTTGMIVSKFECFISCFYCYFMLLITVVYALVHFGFYMYMAE